MKLVSGGWKGGNVGKWSGMLCATSASLRLSFMFAVGAGAGSPIVPMKERRLCNEVSPCVTYLFTYLRYLPTYLATDYLKQAFCRDI